MARSAKYVSPPTKRAAISAGPVPRLQPVLLFRSSASTGLATSGRCSWLLIWPNGALPVIDRLGFAGCGWLSTFCASKRTARLLDSVSRNVLLRLASKRQLPRPMIVLFPRLPFFPGSGCWRTTTDGRTTPSLKVRSIAPAVPAGTAIASASRVQRPPPLRP